MHSVERTMKVHNYMEWLLASAQSASHDGPPCLSCVFPTLPARPFERGEVNVQPYNTLLTLAHLLEVSDGLLLLQNEVLQATAHKQLGIKAPSFQVASPHSLAAVINCTCKRLACDHPHVTSVLLTSSCVCSRRTPHSTSAGVVLASCTFCPAC
jgi:hypothetical protein